MTERKSQFLPRDKVSGSSLPSFVSKMCLELSLTELCQFPDVLYSQDVCDSSAKLASQVTAMAEKQRKNENK